MISLTKKSSINLIESFKCISTNITFYFVTKFDGRKVIKKCKILRKKAPFLLWILTTPSFCLLDFSNLILNYRRNLSFLSPLTSLFTASRKLASKKRKNWSRPKKLHPKPKKRPKSRRKKRTLRRCLCHRSPLKRLVKPNLTMLRLTMTPQRLQLSKSQKELPSRTPKRSQSQTSLASRRRKKTRNRRRLTLKRARRSKRQCLCSLEKSLSSRWTCSQWANSHLCHWAYQSVDWLRQCSIQRCYSSSRWISSRN